MQYKQISPKLKVNYDRLLGKGSTGNVYQCLHINNTNSKQVIAAVKIIPLSEINNEVVSYLLQCQLEALKMTSNPTPIGPHEPQTKQKTNNQQQVLKSNNNGIVQLYEIIVIQGNCYIVMQLLEGMTLKQYIKQQKKLSEEQAIILLKKLLQAYSTIKKHGIVHRDLKPDNIIFSSIQANTFPKIIDFGYCQIMGIKKPNMFYNVGSPRYMSPQAYLGNIYSEKSDIWALGIIFYEMITGTNFDKGKQIKQCFKQIKQMGIPIPSSLGIKSRKILQMMLMYDPQKRNTCKEMLLILNDQQVENMQSKRKQERQQENKAKAQNTFFIEKNAFIRHSLGPFPNRNTIQSRNQIKSYDRTNQINASPEQNRLVRSNVLHNPHTPSARINQNNVNISPTFPKNKQQISSNLNFIQKIQKPKQQPKRNQQNLRIPVRQTVGSQIRINNQIINNIKNNAQTLTPNQTLNPSASQGNLNNKNNNQQQYMNSPQKQRLINNNTNSKFIAKNNENQGNKTPSHLVKVIDRKINQQLQPQQVYYSPTKMPNSFFNRERTITIPQNNQNIPLNKPNLSDREYKVVFNSVAFRKQDMRQAPNVRADNLPKQPVVQPKSIINEKIQWTNQYNNNKNLSAISKMPPQNFHPQRPQVHFNIVSQQVAHN